jgi:hypothetical protein
MIHVSMKFGQIIFSGSEVTVWTNEKCDVRTDTHTDRQTDATEPNTIAPPFWAGAKYISNNTTEQGAILALNLKRGYRYCTMKFRICPMYRVLSSKLRRISNQFVWLQSKLILRQRRQFIIETCSLFPTSLDPFALNSIHKCSVLYNN